MKPDDDKETTYILVLIFFMGMSLVSPIFIIPVMGLVFYMCVTDDDDNNSSHNKLE